MTPEQRSHFESCWRELEPRLRGMLAARRISTDRHEDLVQETALRLYGMWERVDSTRPSWPLAKTIVLNLVRDEFRTKRVLEPLETSPDKAFDYDLEAQGIARIELERVRVALASLTELQRRSLLVEIGVHSEGLPVENDKMTRSRARKRLAALLEQVSALVSLRWARMPDLLHGAGLFKGAGTAGVACLACLFGASVVAIGAGPLASDAGARPSELRRPPVVSAATLIVATSGPTDVLVRDSFLDARDASGKTAPATTSKGSRAGRGADSSSSGTAGGTGVPTPSTPSVPDLSTPGGSSEDVPGVPSVPVSPPSTSMPSLGTDREGGPPSVEISVSAPLPDLESDLPKL